MYNWAINKAKLERAIRAAGTNDEQAIIAKYRELGGKVDEYRVPLVEAKVEQEVNEAEPINDNAEEPKRRGRAKKTDSEVQE